MSASRRGIRRLTGLAACLLLHVITSAAGATIEHATFRGAISGEIRCSPGRTPDVHIDERVDILWDLAGLLVPLAEAEGVVSRGEPLFGRIEALKVAITAFLETEEGLLALKEVSLRIASAETAGDRNRAQSLRNERDTVAARYAGRGLAAIETLKDLDPNLYSAIDSAMVEGNDYQPVVAVIRRRLGDLENELARRMDGGTGVEVFMRADLLGTNGSRTPVHLDNYDDAALGAPRPFPRYQTAADERTLAELRAAENLGSIAQDVLDGTFNRQLDGALGQLRASVRELQTRLGPQFLEEQIDVVVADLDSSANAEFRPVIDEARAVLDLLRPLVRASELTGIRSELPGAPGNAGASGVARLSELHRGLISSGAGLATALDQLPAAMKRFADRIEFIAAARAGIVSAEALAAVRKAATDIAANQETMRTMAATLREITGAVTSSEDLVLDVQQLPRRIRGGVGLDTSFDLMTVPTERHPGDRLIVRFEARRASDSIGSAGAVLASGAQTFRLEHYGLYQELRGALLFVDPRGAIPRDLSYQPAPALGVLWRYGRRDQAWWNEGLSPGLGLSLALLDFEDESDLELGLAANLSVLADLLWIGYGRDLQANADYFYLGINPLAVGRLVRRP